MMKLTKKQAMLYQQRWRRVEALQIRELQTTPMSLKFKQLCWLMNSFRPIQHDKQWEKEVETVRKRWVKLKEMGGKKVKGQYLQKK